MATTYIILTNSNASLSRKFAVLHAGYAPGLEKVGVRRLSVTGKVDNQVGPVLRRWVYTVRTWEASPPTDYGTLANLKTLFSLNDPWGTPSNVITLTDFDDVAYSVYLTNVLAEKPDTYAVLGDDARFSVEIHMQQTTAEVS